MMAAGPKRIDRAARVLALSQRLAGNARAEEILGVVTELESAIRGHAVLARKFPALSRERLTELRRAVDLRDRLDWYVAHELGEARDESNAGAAFAALDPKAQQNLGKLLGVPFDERSREILESFATEHQEQGRIFDEIAQEFGFVEGQGLGVVESRGCLALTHNGSLIQLSAPVDGRGTRRYVYQNIYGNQSVASEGTMVLRDVLAVGRSLDGEGLHSSPIRKLRIATVKADWNRDKMTFARMTHALGDSPLLGLGERASEPAPEPTAGRKTMWGSLSRLFSGKSSSKPGKRSFAASQGRAELRVLAAQLSAGKRGPTLDVEVVGLCIHLQTARIETGEADVPLRSIGGFETDAQERVAIDPSTGRVLLERPSRPQVELPALRIGEQKIVRGAPLALLGNDGSVALLLGSITRVWPRGS